MNIFRPQLNVENHEDLIFVPKRFLSPQNMRFQENKYHSFRQILENNPKLVRRFESKARTQRENMQLKLQHNDKHYALMHRTIYDFKKINLKRRIKLRKFYDRKLPKMHISRSRPRDSPLTARAELPSIKKKQGQGLKIDVTQVSRAPKRFTAFWYNSEAMITYKPEAREGATLT